MSTEQNNCFPEQAKTKKKCKEKILNTYRTLIVEPRVGSSYESFRLYGVLYNERDVSSQRLSRRLLSNRGLGMTSGGGYHGTRLYRYH